MDTLGGLEMRTWRYVGEPNLYDIACDKCGHMDIAWSEFQDRIWCYKCKIDTKGTGGIFPGPIPIQMAEMLGISFDVYDMVEKKVILSKDWK